ncbi:DUF4381 domain-containing protein [Rhizobium sp. S163]|uniref:DUF4381 domain-containing protein n=1 Tax=Rhizobium sp. S163 TaxID=3055039 RepID=UPI0025A9C973|nr:DUF4381 domain-containing protein [Rhizobium sp. S163]MDM9646782.1 DUF4381 domain-containing protein [Rhizobium sp. S163]
MENASTLDPMAETALRSMRDIVTPTPVSWLPQTWGWGMLAGVILALLATWVFIALRRYRRNAYRREALRILETIQTDMAAPERRSDGVRRISELLKRTALAAWPRQSVAPITGDRWTAFLRGSVDDEQEQNLTSALALEYRASGEAMSDETCDEVVANARHWIEKHHVSA